MKIRLTESRLRQIVAESVKRVLNEGCKSSKKYLKEDIDINQLINNDQIEVDEIEILDSNSGVVTVRYNNPGNGEEVTMVITFRYKVKWSGGFRSGDYYSEPEGPQMRVVSIVPTYLTLHKYDEDGSEIESFENEFLSNDHPYYNICNTIVNRYSDIEYAIQESGKVDYEDSISDSDRESYTYRHSRRS